MPEHLAFRAFVGFLECQPSFGLCRRRVGTPTAAMAGLYHTLQISQARVTFTIFRFAGRSAEAETLRFRSWVDAWARTCRGVPDTDSEGDATMCSLPGPDDALTDAPLPAAAAAAAGSPSWLPLRR